MNEPKRKKQDDREGTDPRKPAPAEPQKRDNPDERRPEEWDPGETTP